MRTTIRLNMKTISSLECKCCREVKSVEEFSKVAAHKNKRGYDSWCKSCKRLACVKYRKNNPDKIAVHKRNNQVRRYGISLQDYQNMVNRQENRCAICGSSSDRALDIDHDHKTGKVRGLLCSYCNKAIGMFKDNPEYLKLAIIYLDGHK